MQLVDRYLQAVRFWLPRAQQDDIIAELSEDLRSEIEEQEFGLGRKLNDGEIEAILKQRGRPLLVANRYLPQRSLIGPALFPAYVFVLKIVAAGYIVPRVLVWFGFIAFDPAYRASHPFFADMTRVWGPFWITAMSVIGSTTVIFAILERVNSNSRFLEKWEPKKLPALRDPRKISRVNSTVEIGVNLVFLAWWFSAMGSRTIFDREGVRIVLAPEWQIFFWYFFATAIANIALSAANLLYPQWTQRRGFIRLGTDCVQAIGLCWLAKASILQEIVIPNLSPERAAAFVRQFNILAARSLPFVILGCVVAIGLADIGRLIRLKSGGPRPVQDAPAIHGAT